MEKLNKEQVNELFKEVSKARRILISVEGKLIGTEFFGKCSDIVDELAKFYTMLCNLES